MSNICALDVNWIFGKKYYEYTQNHNIEIIWLSDFKADGTDTFASIGDDEGGNCIAIINKYAEDTISNALCIGRYGENGALIDVDVYNADVPQERFQKNI